MNKFLTFTATIVIAFAGQTNLSAHDTWLETGSATVPVNEYTYVDLMLGNHGNGHRDFKLASKITLAPCTLNVISPGGTVVDLKPDVIDMGSAEKEGFWTAPYCFKEPGVHHFIHTLDTLHRTIRAIKSAKTFVVATPGVTGNVDAGAQDRSHGFGLELVLNTPLTSIQAGDAIEYQVLRSGKPLADARVTFVPRGHVLAADHDPDYERQSDSEGIVRFTPKRGNILLAVVHHHAEDESGDDFESTHYSAAMVIHVPNHSLASQSSR